MADPLYLSLWFPSFDEEDILPRTLSVLAQFPFSAARPGISSVTIQPVSWSEATVLERRFNPGIEPAEAVIIAADLVHPDYAYLFEAYWDLWSPDESGEWVLQPSQVKFIAHGVEFEEDTFQENGHIQVDFGLDTPFLFEERALGEVEQRVKANIHKLVTFTVGVEKNSGIRGRVLWSESQENLAQKLIARLQGMQ